MRQYASMTAPGDARHRYDYVKNLVVPVKCVKFTYTGTKEHLIFLWKVNPNHTESQILSENMKLAAEIRKTLPVFHTRTMRREFLFFWSADSWKNRVFEGSLQATDR